MNELVETASSLGVSFEASPYGRWVRMEDSHGRFVYVIRKPWDGPYVVYCDSLRQQLPQDYGDPESAIQAGLRYLA
ncbi:MAG: hypothetical protein EPO21_16065 [Chloroflexota bacterium]|nr:MAG: hypothetical protein EPO21_16065 [Chloroflexota bacterium]